MPKTPTARKPRPAAPLQRAARRQKLTSREDSVMSTVIFPIPLHAELNRAALALNWGFGHVIRTACAEWLAVHAAELKAVTR